MVDHNSFLSFVDRISEKYGLGAHEEHPYIFEFYEGEEIPLFKLIYGPTDKSGDKNVIVVTLHLELNPVDAIQWYHRVLNIVTDVRLQECYFKDDRGETFLGEHAEALKIYKDEQRVLSEWLDEKQTDDESIKEFAKARAFGRTRSKKSGFQDLAEAQIEFNRIFVPDDDEIQ